MWRLSIISTFLFACTVSNSTVREKKILDFIRFQIEAKPSWKKIKENGIDSYVGGISIDSGESLYFDLGWY
jgi:hypothetical protein